MRPQNTRVLRREQRNAWKGMPRRQFSRAANTCGPGDATPEPRAQDPNRQERNLMTLNCSEPVPVSPVPKTIALPRAAVAALDTGVLSHRVTAVGRCSDRAADAERWFPADEPGPDAAEGERRAFEAAARRACRGCTVRQMCLELALRDEERGAPAHGIYGGRAPWERDELRARRRARELAVAS